MAQYRIITTTDNQHLGETIDSIDKGNLITFSDGDVISIDEVFEKDNSQFVILSGQNYVMRIELIN